MVCNVCEKNHNDEIKKYSEELQKVQIERDDLKHQLVEKEKELEKFKSLFNNLLNIGFNSLLKIFNDNLDNNGGKE